MSKFIPREKMSKKARRELELSQRTMWTVPPVTRKIENKKHDERKRRSCCRYEDYGAGSFFVQFFLRRGLGFRKESQKKVLHFGKTALYLIYTRLVTTLHNRWMNISEVFFRKDTKNACIFD